MERTCPSCDAAVAADGWCPRCLTTSVPSRLPPPPVATAYEGRRTARSSVTFGPVGRVLWSVAVLAPPAVLLWWGSLYVGWGFAALWWGVITPWALRDLWRSGRRRRSC